MSIYLYSDSPIEKTNFKTSCFSSLHRCLYFGVAILRKNQKNKKIQFFLESAVTVLMNLCYNLVSKEPKSPQVTKKKTNLTSALIRLN